MWKALLSLLCFCLMSFGQRVSFEKALSLYNSGRYEASIKVLPEETNNPVINCLLGKNYYMLGNFKKSSDFFKDAAEADDKNTEYQLWAGRAFGRRAENSSPLRAPDYAGKALEYFEKAVELEPDNLDALGDLFDYYLRAPGFLGGGTKKAEDIAERVARINRAEGRRFQGHLLEKKKKFAAAERNFKEAVGIEPGVLNYRIELAKFLSRQGKYTESEKVFVEAARISPKNYDILYERAETYIQEKRNLVEAKALLEEFIKKDLTNENVSRYEAEKLLKKIK
jgi:tetratricopeptide (TPR) repeat protein